MAIQIYPSHVKAEQNVQALEALKQAPVGDLRSKYRLLPTTPMYLLASRYYAEEGNTWLLTSKWDMFKFLDKALKNCMNQRSLDQITKAIDLAIVDQRKIALLKTTHFILSDSSKSRTEKTNAFLSIKDKDPAFYDNIKNAIWVVNGRNPNASWDFSDKKIENEPDHLLHREVLERMASTLKAGYTNYNPETFKGI